MMISPWIQETDAEGQISLLKCKICSKAFVSSILSITFSVFTGNFPFYFQHCLSSPSYLIRQLVK